MEVAQASRRAASLVLKRGTAGKWQVGPAQAFVGSGEERENMG
jgi:hypothetical protein